MNRRFLRIVVSLLMVDESSKKGQIGLANLGNTCYLNAVIQCVRHVPDLTVFFHKYSTDWIHTDDQKNSSLCNAYKDLITTMWSGTPPGYLRPGGFLHKFREALHGTRFDHMITPQQHDGHEALMFLLDQLHEGMKKPLIINITATEDSPVYAALTAWKEKVAPEYSPIVDYFFGLMEVSVTCKGCGNISCRYESFNMLNIDFPEFKDATIEDCINDAFKPEELDEYSCDNCSPDQPKDSPKLKRHPGVIQRRIWRLPQNLIVVVKRFIFDIKTMHMIKCNANFSAESTQKFEKWFSEKSPESSRTADYSLQSTVDHHGNANGGHYTAQVKSPITGLWNMYDDETVNMMRDGSTPHLGSMTYILFYRKVA